MEPYKTEEIASAVGRSSYPGRGIIVGTSPDAKYAAAAYFIMGRSENSRNRVFRKFEGGVRTEPFDASKVTDPSLIIYNAVRSLENCLIVTNGDQTDTVYDGINAGLGFAEALRTRTFEPDSPNFTPRISAALYFGGGFYYDMSILKSIDSAGSDCCRFTYSYPAMAGGGHFIHTYAGDGSPLPTFCGEPERVYIPDTADALADAVWQSLDDENKISLYVRYTDIASGEYTEKIINKNI